MSLTYGIEDEKEELSVGTIELNEVVLAMRPLVKAAQILVLREIAKYIKQLKKKQKVAPADKKNRIGRKIVGRLSEIRLLKKMGTIRLCKLLLANVMTQKELERGGESLSRQDRVILRLAACPQIVAFISKFRLEHSDWPTLVHYLLYKNTSGKWKTQEQKKRSSKNKKGDLPFPLLESLPKQNDGDDDDQNDNNIVNSTVKKFAAFKEKHDRELLTAQKKILADEAAENPTTVIHNKPSLFSSNDYHNHDDDETHSDTSQLADDIVARLVGGGTQNEVEIISNKPADINRKASVMKLEVKSARQEFQIKPVQKKTEKVKLKRKKNNASVEREPISQPDLVVEIIENEIPLPDILKAEDEDLLGEDDVEMKQELKTNKAKPGDSAVFRRYIQQQNRSSFARNIGGRGRGGSGDFSGPAYRGRGRGVDLRGSVGGKRGASRNSTTSSFDSTDLHPSWVAKRTQKSQVISINPSPSTKRITFDN